MMLLQLAACQNAIADGVSRGWDHCSTARATSSRNEQTSTRQGMKSEYRDTIYQHRDECNGLTKPSEGQPHWVWLANKATGLIRQRLTAAQPTSMKTLFQHTRYTFLSSKANCQLSVLGWLAKQHQFFSTSLFPRNEPPSIYGKKHFNCQKNYGFVQHIGTSLQIF